MSMSFNHRVAGIALREEHVLLHRPDGYDFWFLPGGHIELGETAAEALLREMQEELDCTVEVSRLVWIMENFFTGSNCERLHEVAWYFLMNTPALCEYPLDQPFRGMEANRKLTFQWYPRDQLAELPLYPVALRTGLRALPTTIMHLVAHE
ncbi:MAG TPA: NUDIX hydrolase [Ktedonobacteraceae bacterium]|jgi:ADP-ribose pyrophosphatase YjhB (NUDIX family)